MLRCQFENNAEASLRHVVVDVLIFNQTETKILLVRRTKKLLEGGKLALPGGYVERDETCQQAAQREVLEETGYQIEEPKLFFINDDPQRPHEDRQNITFIYTSHALAKVAQNDWENTDVAWFDLKSLTDLDSLAFDHGQAIQRWLTAHSRT